ncbi:MAG: SgcJ/EcaC family oxidoreductase [Chloroflexi bacterium]|nr:MAG: SgcJ/EcaC family oxidoreductase [Chloroflexota bacterium]
MVTQRRRMLKTYLVLAIIGVLLLSASAAGAQSPQQTGSSDSHEHDQSEAHSRDAIKAVLKSYELALNASDVQGVVKLYTDDAVLLPPNAPSGVGIDAVRATYAGIFQTIHINLTFEIAEVKVVSPEWAFLRSTSNGTVTILANGAQILSSNHELFVLHKTQGGWKLARYSFSSVLPAA